MPTLEIAHRGREPGTVDAGHSAISLSALIRSALRRHIVIVLALTALGGAIGAAAAALQPVSYTSTASVLIRPAAGNSLSPQTPTGNGTQLTVAMTTEVSLVTTPAVAALASKEYGSTLPGPQERVAATVPPSTQIITVSYTAPTAEKAQRAAEAYATAFLAFRAANARQVTDNQVAALQKQLASATAALKTAALRAASETDPRAYSAQQVQLYAERIAALNNSISTIETTGQDAGSVVRSSGKPSGPNGIESWMFVAAGLTAGLLLGVAAAVMRRFSDDRIDPKTDTTVAGRPVLAQFPKNARLPLDAEELAPSEDEALRQARTALVAMVGQHQAVALSPVATTADSALFGLNLARALSQSGYRVALVDASVMDETLLQRLSVEPSTDLTSSLGDGPTGGLFDIQSLASAGHVEVSSDVDALAGPGFRQAVLALKAQHDYVLVVGSALGTGAGDAAVAAADSTVLLAQAARTSHAEVASAVVRAERLSSPVVGAILCGRTARGRQTTSARRDGARAGASVLDHASA